MTTHEETCDICIVGGGMSGLLSAYMLEQRYPHKRIYLLEKKGAFLSGIHMITGDMVRDNEFLHVLNDLGVPFIVDTGLITYDGIVFPYEERLKELAPYATSHKSFKELYLSHFTEADYEMFALITGGKETYEHADSKHVIEYYPFEESVYMSKFEFSPLDFCMSIIKKLRNTRLYLNTCVEIVQPNYVKANNISLRCKDIIITCFSVANKVCPFLKKGIKVIDTYKIYIQSDNDSLYSKKSYVKNMLEKIYNNGSGNYIAELYNHAILKCSVGQIKNMFKHPVQNIQCIWNLKNYYYYTPLSKMYSSREEYIQHMSNPRLGIFIISNFLSHWPNSLQGFVECLQNINIKK